ncbi:hypothetical protein [Methylobacterium sp. E-046]|uniref:hypothetical protein n=1 Tax=Methylobacterium sp. E-046 TaxID=2836576 RepID=UPI001FB94A32|nr:hypothetical protein [Methylobacterium sp. E-046]MCJ2099367.1 hypothetical protein [Methylobacterium sp. E-046]
MSAETLRRIMDETDERLAVASYGDETLAIGIETMAALGVDAAETLFVRVAGASFTDAEINTAILSTLNGLQGHIIESFDAFGIKEHPFLDQCLEAVASGFLNRGEALFSGTEQGGRA